MWSYCWAEANWEVPTPYPPRRSWHQQLEARWWSCLRSLDAPTSLYLHSCVAHIIIFWDTACWKGFSSYTMSLTLTTILYPFLHLSCCTSPRLQDIVGSCLPPLNPSSPNPHLTYHAKVLWRPCCTSNAFTLFCHKLKLSLLLNFSTSNSVVELPIFDISPFVNL